MKKTIEKIATFFSVFIPVNENKIIFESGRGRADDNPRAIYEYFKSNEPNYSLKYFIYKNSDHDGLSKEDIVYYKSLKYFYHMSSAKILVKSNSVRSYVKKKKDQTYIQLWHGAEFKNCDPKDSTLLPLEHIKDWDVFIANDELQYGLITKQTGYQKYKYIGGMPRTDFMHNKKNQGVAEFKKSLSLNEHKRTILYAPTFRDRHLSMDKKTVNLEIHDIIRDIESVLSEDDILVIRLHPLLKDIDLTEFISDTFVDLSAHNDGETILLASDVLITDYSSIIYDFAILERPTLIYAYDNEKYIKDRGEHYLNIQEEVPALFSEDIAQLSKNLELLNSELMKTRINNFNNTFNKYNDGEVSKRISNLIKNI